MVHYFAYNMHLFGLYFLYIARIQYIDTRNSFYTQLQPTTVYLLLANKSINNKSFKSFILLSFKIAKKKININAK